MSTLLWKHYLEDDVDGFLRLLENARVVARPRSQKGAVLGYNTAHQPSVASPPTPIASPPSATRSVGVSEKNRLSTKLAESSPGVASLTRADINRRDSKGLAILHYAASSPSPNARAFALALTAHPSIDLYIQDFENGWTALHRAFYFGNITIALAIMERDAQLHTEQTCGGSHWHISSLIKVKDKEGHGPLDLYAASINARPLRFRDNVERAGGDSLSDGDDHGGVHSTPAGANDSRETKYLVPPSVDIGADEVFAFGSNKNFSLGIGNENERHFPEKILFQRPKHLFRRFHREHVDAQATRLARSNPAHAEMLRASLRDPKDVSELPNVVRLRPITIQDVQMAKFHSAILTNDPISNLYICGHGLGGRLGAGDEKTRSKFICIETYCSEHRKIVAVALGQDHTMAVSDKGELFTWGSNEFGQLGFGFPKEDAKKEELIQLSPRQIFGSLKKEIVVGVAASRIHSIAHTKTSVFTWGKNEGQLGLIDAQAGTLKTQATPRQVGASRFSCGIRSVSAIDRASTCLLENHEVHVFANYGAVKLQFPLEGFANYFLRSSFLATNYDKNANTICKVAAGGNTICALSTAGQVFTVAVNQRLDPRSSSSTSTTNPNKIRAALSTPYCAWSLKKDNMAARDVAVDQDGSVVLTTESGSVWRRTRRPKVSGVSASNSQDQKAREFKYSRVPNLTGALAVRASASGAWMVMRQDCDVTKTKMTVDSPSLWKDLFSLLPIRSLLEGSEEELANPPTSYWQRPDELTKLIARISQAKDLEAAAGEFLSRAPKNEYDASLSTSTSDIAIPAQLFIISSRSSPIRAALSSCRRNGGYSSESLSIESGSNGKTLLKFSGLDFLTLIELVLYFYTDSFVGFWQHTRNSLAMAPRYRQVRVELMKLASRLDLKNLESAARRMVSLPEPSLSSDMELALLDRRFFESCDAVVHLSDGEVPIHSKLVARRCPFFEGLFEGHASGRWLTQRRDWLPSSNAVSIDLGHVETHVFKLALRHIYTDLGEELFDAVVSRDQEEFLDLIMDVLSVANELMLDRLSQSCQAVLGRYVTTRNVCQLLNAVAPSSVTEFKTSCLVYLCLSLEPMLCNHFLEELDEDILHELDETVKANQLSCLPFAKSGLAETALLEKYPSLVKSIDRSRQAKVDAIDLQTKITDVNISLGSYLKDQDSERLCIPYQHLKKQPRPSAGSSETSTTPMIPAVNRRAPLSSPENHHNLPAPLIRPLSSDRLLPNGDGIALPSINAARANPLAANAADEGSGSVLLGLNVLRNDSVDENRNHALLSTSPASRVAANDSSRPWGPTPTLTGRLNMQEIMKQASLSRKSNLSKGLEMQAATTDPSLGSHHTRLSQKERKKRQDSEKHPSAGEDQSQSSAPSCAIPTSPWKNTPALPRPSTEEQGALTPVPPRGASPPLLRFSTTPHLTMRQTIANAPASKQKEPPATPPTIIHPSKYSTSSSPRTAGAESSPGAGHSQPRSGSKAISIQSIRHTPKPQDVSPSLYMHQSMANIISQEQAEKVAVKEAAAKRSLQEIQQEQEFQEWWDKESRAVQEAATAAEARETRSGSSRRGRNRRGRGKEEIQARERNR